jgi:hypothetical protein
MGTLKDIDVEIYTPQDDYVLGENFTAVVYFVNDESEDIWIEGLHQYTINCYSLSHPMEGITADVQVMLDASAPWIHVPAYSMIMFDHVYCDPEYSGDYRISCLGAEKTVLILSRIAVRVQLDAYSYADERPVLSITNYGSNVVTYGSEYKIERRKGESWIEVSPFPPNSAWTAVAIIVRPGETRKQSIKIDGLEPGEFRLSKTVRDEVIEKSTTFIMEFEIKK